MDSDQNWYRQLLALVLLSASRTAVDFLTNPNSREDTTNQLKSAIAEIDYEAVAGAVTNIIDSWAESSKGRLNETIDTLRDKSVDVVGDAKDRAAKQLGQIEPKKKGKKKRFVFGILLGALIAYFVLDEQRRDDLLDRLTGASGPIQQTTQNVSQQASSVVHQATSAAQQVAKTVTDSIDQAGDDSTKK